MRLEDLLRETEGDFSTNQQIFPFSDPYKNENAFERLPDCLSFSLSQTLRTYSRRNGPYQADRP